RLVSPAEAATRSARPRRQVPAGGCCPGPRRAAVDAAAPPPLHGPADTGLRASVMGVVGGASTGMAGVRALCGPDPAPNLPRPAPPTRPGGGRARRPALPVAIDSRTR